MTINQHRAILAECSNYILRSKIAAASFQRTSLFRAGMNLNPIRSLFGDIPEGKYNKNLIFDLIPQGCTKIIFSVFCFQL